MSEREHESEVITRLAALEAQLQQFQQAKNYVTHPNIRTCPPTEGGNKRHLHVALVSNCLKPNS